MTRRRRRTRRAEHQLHAAASPHSTQPNSTHNSTQLSQPFLSLSDRTASDRAATVAVSVRHRIHPVAHPSFQLQAFVLIEMDTSLSLDMDGGEAPSANDLQFFSSTDPSVSTSAPPASGTGYHYPAGNNPYGSSAPTGYGYSSHQGYAPPSGFVQQPPPTPMGYGYDQPPSVGYRGPTGSMTSANLGRSSSAAFDDEPPRLEGHLALAQVALLKTWDRSNLWQPRAAHYPHLCVSTRLHRTGHQLWQH